ncbi:hypothetical protein FW778_21310 [Ginsengibacter hankyongi]|uniref:DUF4350 domain-containing protein n=1 Tax=Ginsengibacter hankyongi TaxID=2607284 RepID=A0A5J5IB48_9BACT|nr:hypothetical protein [Ginsengibacter hankyongi]KAA9035500.1 hypothetical protein FW778_21310 [Ginsengibacter hankyongi]
MKTVPLIYFMLIFSLVFILSSVKGQQINDSSFNTNLLKPAYLNKHPSVLIDAAHYNAFFTLNRIQPFCKLIYADGYNVDTIGRRFNSRMLSNYDIVVIFTAQGGPDESDSAEFSAFSDSEIEALINWIKKGGSLLFGVDHSPFNYAGLKLLTNLGIGLSFGRIEDSVFSEGGIENGPDGRRGTLIFSRQNELLGNHVITSGRNYQEQINKVITDGGQALKPPKGSITLFRISNTAYNGGIGNSDSYRMPVGVYNAQAIAFTLGNGRAVITADCSMWTAQLVKFNNKWVKYGMSRTDTDNRQFALNVMHWLSHLIN